MECNNTMSNMCDTVDIKEFKKETEATPSEHDLEVTSDIHNVPGCSASSSGGEVSNIKEKVEDISGDNCLNFLIKEEEEVHLPNVYGALLEYTNMYLPNEEDEKPFLGFQEDELSSHVVSNPVKTEPEIILPDVHEGVDLVEKIWLQPEERSCDLRFICHHCKFYTSSKSSLRRHILAGHINNKVYECPDCGYRNYNRSQMKAHIMVKHTSERPYECDVCKKKFTLLGYLTMHNRIHTGEKPFVCKFCKKRYASTSSLSKHLKMHTDDKPFQCEVCETRFLQSNSLKTHMRIHTGDKPFQCEVCEMRFTYKAKMNLHKRSHMNVYTHDKPFLCVVCNKRFSHSCSFKRHMKEHTGDKPFVCEVCKKKFSRSCSLKKHMMLHTCD